MDESTRPGIWFSSREQPAKLGGCRLPLRFYLLRWLLRERGVFAILG
jgi:hypothetical protein